MGGLDGRLEAWNEKAAEATSDPAKMLAGLKLAFGDDIADRAVDWPQLLAVLRLILDLLDEVSAAVTTAELSELNKRYGIDAEDADALAAEWLEANGF